MKSIKSLSSAFLGALVASPSIAGGMAEPYMEPTVIEEDTTSSSRAGILVPILAILLFIIASGNNGAEEVPSVIEPTDLM